MHPVIFLSIYAVLTIMNGMMTDFCLRRWPLTTGQAGKRRSIWLIPQFLFALAPVAGTFLENGHLRYALQGIGNIYLGFFIYYGFFLALLLLVTVPARLIRRKRFSTLYGVILCLSFFGSMIVGIYGLFHAQDTRVYRYDIAVDKPGKDMTVVLIADLHLSANSHLSTTERMVEMINRENPDLVLVAGDIFTSSYEALFDPDT